MQTEVSRGNDILHGVIWKQLLGFFFPILLGTFFQQLYNTADAIIVGRFVGKEALAAVGGATGTIINLFVNLFVGLSSGVTVSVAQHYGAQRFENVEKTVHCSVAMALVGGFAMTALGVAFSPMALSAMGTPEDIMEPARVYIQIYFLGMPASFLYNVGSAVQRAAGDTRRPLYFLIAACISNIILDLLLVVKLGLGVMGVGIATTVSQVISAVLVLLSLMRDQSPCHLAWKRVRFHAAALKEIVRVGFPAGIQSNMYAISNIMIQSCINSFGTDTMAAWTAFGKADSFFWMILSAYGISVTTFVGQNFGAGLLDRVKKSVRVCLAMSLGTAFVMSFLFCFFREPVFAVFTDDPGVVAAGAPMVFFSVPFYFVFVFVEILSGAVRGAGDALCPMLITCGGVCVLRILWILLVVPLHRDLPTLLLSYPITWVITAAMFIVYYLHGGWLRRQRERLQQPGQ